MSRPRTLAAAVLLLAGIALGAAEKTVAINDYVGIAYDREPVSCEWELNKPAPLASIGFTDPEQPVQVELLAGTPEAASLVRVWTTASFPFITVERKGKTRQRPDIGAKRHKLLTLTTAANPVQKPVILSRDAGSVGTVPIAVLANDRIRIKVPAQSVTFDPPASALTIPGPVISIARGEEAWVGHGYLDTIACVSAIDVVVTSGPVFTEHRIIYHFDNNTRYQVQVRLVAGKPFVSLVENFNVGGQARYVFNYDDWECDASFRTGDSRRYGWQSLTEGNPCNDFVKVHGQRALSRMVVWTQFNYFGGKQETIGLKAPDHEAHKAAHERAMAKWQRAVQKWQEAQEKKPDPNKTKPAQPVFIPAEPATIELAGASRPTLKPFTPGGSSTMVGAFYIRPDRWTRAKVNHVDLYMRPEVPGDRMTRGIVGLAGAVLRPAMEAWLVDGHREWAIFAVDSGNAGWLARAHIREGLWNLDRLNRMPLVWNSDGSAVDPAKTIPSDGTVDGAAAQVMHGGPGGRGGLQYFNGSNPHIRQRYPKAKDAEAKPVTAGPEINTKLASLALAAYFSADEATYPGRRAMLPWSDPEALNPFYQGMENMNFNADLYRWVVSAGIALKARNHPNADDFIQFGHESFDMALDAYVYPESGCWEESHGYAGHTVGVVTPLAYALKDLGINNYFNDARLLRMLHFFTRAYSPVDLTKGGRIIPPIGDHGLSISGPNGRLGKKSAAFTVSDDQVNKHLLAEISYQVAEDFGTVPEGISPIPPDRSSTWLDGYGMVMRAQDASYQALRIRLPKAAWNPKSRKNKERDVFLTIPIVGTGITASPLAHVVAQVPGYAKQAITCRTDIVQEEAGAYIVHITMDLPTDHRKRVVPGQGIWTLTIGPGDDGSWSQATATGTYTVKDHTHPFDGTGDIRLSGGESQIVLRSGQSWGHHHEDKASLWAWFKGVPLFGDASWGSPPGGTYGNPYKQGAASGTQIQFHGINNWTLPCKYPAGWIAEHSSKPGVDYALARNLHPYNPKLQLKEDAPAALSNGHDRQTIFIHPDILLVHDTIDSAVPTTWRLHSYRGKDTTVGPGRATLPTPYGWQGHLQFASPAEVSLQTIDAFPAQHPYGREPNNYAGQPFGSRILRWDMPIDSNATWVVSTAADDAAAATVTAVDGDDRVTRIELADGRRYLVFCSTTRFEWTGPEGTFVGRVGVIRLDQPGQFLLDGELKETD